MKYWSQEIKIENDKLNLNFSKKKMETMKESEDIKEDINNITNVNDYIKETENEIENKNKNEIQRQEFY